MKNNTEKVKNLLHQALLNTPDDFALSEVRSSIRFAMRKIEEVETKRSKREQIQKTDEIQRLNVGNGIDYRQALDAIDEMIDAERTKIKNIRERRNNRSNGFDDEGSLIRD
jgi:hypothetical protein